MKINFIWFSCLRDLRALYYSIKSVKRFFPDSNFHIYIEENLSIFFPEEKNIYIHLADFDFKKNLNGFDFIVNELSVFKKHSKNCDYICKIDSDVMMFSDAFLEYCYHEYDLIGKYNEIEIKKGKNEYAYGGFYLIKSSIFENCKDFKEVLIKHQKTKFKNKTKWAEDERVSSFILEHTDHFFLQKDTPEDKKSILGFWRYDLVNDNRPIDYVASLNEFCTVEFGRISNLNSNIIDKYKTRDKNMCLIYNFLK